MTRQLAGLAIRTILALGVLFGILSAQETQFGKNKVIYKDFEWNYIQTRHFDIHFYADAYQTAKFAATVMESSYVEITRELKYNLQRRVPVFVYNSHNDFQQTNIIPDIIPEGVGGFTEAFKNRIVIPFAGNYEDFRHVLHHELTHALVYDLLYGNRFSSLLSRQRLFNLPLWFAEGFAEYSSRHGWDYFADMFVRDATINNYLAPPDYLGGFLAYKQGQAMVKYIADKYGEDKLGDILQKGRIYLTMNKALKETIGKDEKEFFEDFAREMKRRYWPEIARRKEPVEMATQLTHAREDGSYFNEMPVFNPDGDKIAIFTDKSDYTEIVYISATDGERREKLVKSERSGDLESLHSFVSGISFSPDGKQMAFVAKSEGKDAIFIHDLRKNNTARVHRFDFYNIVSPAWSPDGKMIAFSALDDNTRDLYVWNLETDNVNRLMSDLYDDIDPTWMPNSLELVFSSDRPHPGNPDSTDLGNSYVSPGARHPGPFVYGFNNLFRINIHTGAFDPLEVGQGENIFPRVSPDGKKVAFVSNRNGIDNIYVSHLDSSGSTYPVTDILTGVKSLSWSPGGGEIAFSAFNKGAFDIFLLKNITPVGKNGQLESTDFFGGKYDLIKSGEAHAALQKSGTAKVMDSSLADSTQTPDSTALAVSDSLTMADSTVIAQADSTAPPKDEITTSGIYDGEFVYVGHDTKGPLDSLLSDVSRVNVIDTMRGRTEPAFFDSIPLPTQGADFDIHPYTTKFTADYVGGGFAYDSFFGMRGQSYFIFSDYLGNHQFYIVADLVNTIDQSFVQAYYFNNTHRTNFGTGLFHTKNFYLDSDNYLFSDRFYGISGSVSRPFSMFSRLELVGSQVFIDREYLDTDDFRSNRSTKVTTGTFAYVTDNIVWGHTGPVNGRRARLALSAGVNLFDSRDIEFNAFDIDLRKYWHFHKYFSVAFRAAGGISGGVTPKQYFLGGTTNFIGNRTLDARVYQVENLYFSDVVTPLRGVDYYELSGTRYGLVNWEFRFPFVEYFVTRFPLQMTIANVTGAAFLDMGAAWTVDREFKGGTSKNGSPRLTDIKSGFGFGMRANLGFLLLRYDLAWTTDFAEVSAKPRAYFSFGADF
jgi:Tol biopolymer transport system component